MTSVYRDCDIIPEKLRSLIAFREAQALLVPLARCHFTALHALALAGWLQGGMTAETRAAIVGLLDVYRYTEERGQESADLFPFSHRQR